MNWSAKWESVFSFLAFITINCYIKIRNIVPLGKTLTPLFGVDIVKNRDYISLMFKWNLKSAIENKGISQAELAKKAKVSKNTICVLCKSESHSVSLRTLAKLSTALEVEPWNLVDYNPNGTLKAPEKGIYWSKNSM